MLKTKILIKEKQLMSLLTNGTLLTEADRRQVIMDKIGWSKEWADEFHNLSDKYSVWIADSFLKRIMAYYGEDGNAVLDSYRNTPPYLTRTWTNEIKGNYEYILDWLKSPRREQIDLKNLTYNEALKKAGEWHKTLKAEKANQYKEKNEIILDYRNDKGVGFYWVNLGKSYCDEEAKRMGHCGRGRGKLFSLRNINEFGEGQSFVTVDYNDGVTRDFKANGNQKPSEKYHKYIIDLLRQKKYPISHLSNEGHQPETNFKLRDLTKEQIDYVFSKNKALMYDINNPDAIPHILTAILNNEIDFESYDKRNQLKLIRASKKNPILVEKFVSKIKDFTILNGFNENDSKLILDIGSEAFKKRLNQIIKKGNITEFLHALRDISTIVYEHNTNIIDIFCKVLDKGFKKFDSEKETILRTKGISKQLFKCGSTFDLINQYQFGGNPNKYNQIIAIGGNKGSDWGVVDLNGNVVIDFEYESIGLKDSVRGYIAKGRDGSWTYFNSEGQKVIPQR